MKMVGQHIISALRHVRPLPILLLMAGFWPLLQSPADAQGYQGQGYSEGQNICVKLEQQLAEMWVQSNQNTTNLPKLRQDIRESEQQLRRAEAQAERADCYEYAFIFGKSLRRTKRCIGLHRAIEDTRRTVDRLKNRLSIATNSNTSDGRRRQLIEALARNSCGAQYQREARQTSNNFFDQLFGGGNNNYYNPSPRFQGPQTGHILPYATYRTMCVRKCDGYYYPVSYSALSSKFAEDSDKCVATCAAPAELFVHRNPGEDVEHMVSLSGIPYSEMPNAWRYRKEFVRGCSCNEAEYKPESDGPGFNGGPSPSSAPGAPGLTPGSGEQGGLRVNPSSQTATATSGKRSQ